MSYSQPRNTELTFEGALDRADERGDDGVARRSDLVALLRPRLHGRRVMDVFCATKDGRDEVLVVWEDAIVIAGPGSGDLRVIDIFDYRECYRLSDRSFRLDMHSGGPLVFDVAPGSAMSFFDNARAQAD